MGSKEKLVWYDGRVTSVYLDDQQVQLEGADLESVLAAATDHLAPTGRIVVEVQIDGQSLVADELDQRCRAPVGQAELRLYSADPQELAVITLEQVREKLNDARQAQAQAADLLQRDEPDRAMQEVGRVIEVWQQAQQAVLGSSRLLGMTLDDKEVDGQSIHELAAALIEKLKELTRLLTTRDTVGLADTLAYEWPQTVDTWDRFIGSLVRWIQQINPEDRR